MYAKNKKKPRHVKIRAVLQGKKVSDSEQKEKVVATSLLPGSAM